MYFAKGNINLSGDIRKNILEVDQIFYKIVSLNSKQKKSKGGNSSVFKIIDPNNSNEYIIKFSKYPRNRENMVRNSRFQHEIEALYEAKEKGFNNIITILFDGVYRIEKQNFLYYVMEKADSDLTTFFRENSISVTQKILLCYDIIRGINELHSMDLYHRDIKPDNIFFVNNNWKIGDLGLSQYRHQEFTLDKFNEKIGPYGWLSPEVMNKVLCENTVYADVHHNIIDDFSDIFQLGKLIWFIFNGNVPIGQLEYSDFLCKRKDIFKMVFKMLRYNRIKRGNLTHYEAVFRILAN